MSKHIYKELVRKETVKAELKRTLAGMDHNVDEWVDRLKCEEPTKAHWLLTFTGYDCSSCGGWIDSEIENMMEPRQLPKHCPYCGAPMEEETGLSDEMKAHMDENK